MSQCESRYKGHQCARLKGHGDVHFYATPYSTNDIVWTDEQADKPGAECFDVASTMKPIDFVKRETGKSREWWRYHYAGLEMRNQAVNPPSCTTMEIRKRVRPDLRSQELPEARDVLRYKMALCVDKADALLEELDN